MGDSRRFRRPPRTTTECLFLRMARMGYAHFLFHNLNRNPSCPGVHSRCYTSIRQEEAAKRDGPIRFEQPTLPPDTANEPRRSHASGADGASPHPPPCPLPGPGISRVRPTVPAFPAGSGLDPPFANRYRKVTGAQKSAYFSKAADCAIFTVRAGKPANPRRCLS